MKRTLSILALLATAVIASVLTSAITVTITHVQAQVRNAGAIVVTLTDSKTDASNWARVVAVRAKGGIALLLCDLPAGFYTAVVLARE